jgi:hypothetical protein
MEESNVTAVKRPLKVITDHDIMDWAPLLKGGTRLWEDAKARATTGERVLMGTAVGGSTAMSLVESMLAVALTLRGARVETLLCDRAISACLHVEKQSMPDTGPFIRGEFNEGVTCANCLDLGSYIYEPLGLASHNIGNFLNGADRAEARRLSLETPLGQIRNFRIGGKNVGEHAFAGALRYFASGNLNAEPDGDIVARRYFEGALLTSYAVSRLLDGHAFSAACFNHGIYSPHGVIGEECRSNNVRVVNWSAAYRSGCFIFSHNDTYHHTMLDEPTSAWENMPWTDAMERDILDYLKSRWTGSRDWIWFNDRPDEDIEKAFAELGIDRSMPVIGMLTNVMWDAQLHYRANAFPDMLSWAVETIKHFAGRPDLQLLIRVHPAELKGLISRQPLVPEIAKAFPKLPDNVFIIGPESPVSTYGAMSACDSAIIYGTKTGVELTSMGIPVIVGGEAWIKNKGITLDASSRAEYFAHLARLPLGKRLDPGTVARARKYAYHFFFRRMVPLGFMAPSKGWPPFRVNISSLEELMPGADPGLDVICDGILSGAPFIYPAETLGVGE